MHPSITEADIIEHYRRLVGALLEHTWLDHEGSEVAIGDFLDSGDRATPILRHILALQEQDSVDQGGVPYSAIRAAVNGRTAIYCPGCSALPLRPLRPFVTTDPARDLP